MQPGDEDVRGRKVEKGGIYRKTLSFISQEKLRMDLGSQIQETRKNTKYHFFKKNSHLRTFIQPIGNVEPLLLFCKVLYYPFLND